MVKFYYFLRIAQLLAPPLWGAVTGVIEPFVAGMVYFMQNIWETTGRIADGMLLNVMRGRVLPSTWSVFLYWLFRAVALLGMIFMLEIFARLILWVPRILAGVLSFLAWLLQVLF
jgi:hypothetical protein